MPCLDARQLECMLAGFVAITDDEARQLELHLTECASCSDLADQIGARDTLSSAVRTRVELPALDAPAAAWLTRMRPTSLRASTETAHTGTAQKPRGPKIYSFLSPPQQVDEIGRLG